MTFFGGFLNVYTDTNTHTHILKTWPYLLLFVRLFEYLHYTDFVDDLLTFTTPNGGLNLSLLCLRALIYFCVKEFSYCP